MCTQNIKDISGYMTPKITRNNERREKTGMIIRRAIRHEATHVAQACNGFKLLNLVKNQSKVHSWYIKEALRASTSVSNISQEREYEAYLMEDRPRLVVSALKKYCL